MNGLSYVLACTCLILAVDASVASAARPIVPDDQLPTYIAPYTDHDISEDGKLDEPIWDKAQWSRDFAWIDTGKPLELRTRFKCVYGPNKLSFGLEMEIPANEPVPINPDFPRAIEVFLDPQGRGLNYMEWAADPNGNQHSNIWRNRVSIAEYTGETRIGTILGVNKVKSQENREIVTFELSFTWKELGRVHRMAGKLPNRGDYWRMNFSRVDMGEYFGDYTWSIPVMYYLHTPNTFGYLIFAGQNDPITSADQVKLKRLPDVAETIKDNKHFKLLYRDFFLLNLVSLGEGKGLLVAPKSYVTKIDDKGNEIWRVTPKDGLPQFSRTYAVTPKGVYIGGDRLGAGAAFVDNAGRAHHLDESDGMKLTGRINITKLSDGNVAFVAGNKYQLMVDGELREPVQCADIIKAVSRCSANKLALGTVANVEIRDYQGRLISDIPVVGGVREFVDMGDTAVGISGNLGMFSFSGNGGWKYFPYPLRIGFNKLYKDSKNRVWAALTGGVVMVEDEKVQLFTEPAGMGGFNVMYINETASGSIVMTCYVPLGTSYNSGKHTAFLLIYKNGKWTKIGYPEGLPGYPTPMVRHGDKLLIGTAAGVYEFIE